MKQVHRLWPLLAVFLLFAGITPCASAFTVSSVNVNPPGNPDAGTTLTVTVAIDFSPEGSETFPSDSELRMSTDLVDQHWAPVLVLDGVETRLLQKNNEPLVLPGWYLSYPPAQKEHLRVTLTGNIPANPSPGQDLLKIQETDSGSTIVKTARVAMPMPSTAIQAAVPATAVPKTTLSAPVKKPATKKIFTPIPTDTPTEESPAGIGAGIIAITVAALLIKRK